MRGTNVTNNNLHVGAAHFVDGCLRTYSSATCFVRVFVCVCRHVHTYKIYAECPPRPPPTIHQYASSPINFETNKNVGGIGYCCCCVDNYSGIFFWGIGKFVGDISLVNWYRSGGRGGHPPYIWYVRKQPSTISITIPQTDY